MEKTDLPSDVFTKDPMIHDSAFIAKGAQVMGDVHLMDDSSIWYNAVLRGDINKIVVGKRTNIQDGSVLHVENDRACIVGNDVTVGHRAILHGCIVDDGCLIGMGAIVLNGAYLKKGAVIGAGAVVKENTVVEENSLMVGVPAKPVKVLPNSYDNNVKWAAKYVEIARIHRKKS